jgi:hypothetical protein
MRVRLTNPTQLEDFLDFIWGSGFIGVVEGPDVLSVSLPYSLGNGRTAADGELFLSLWLGVGIRVWNDLSPEGQAFVLAAPDQVERVSHG